MEKQELEARILEGIPLSRSMAFEVVDLDDHSVRVKGHHKENLNVHGTAFAGSLYAICTLAVWGLVFSRLPDNASLVMANGQIDYLRPVTGDIVSDAQVSDLEMTRFLNELDDTGKSRLELSARVLQAGKTAVKFTANLYAKLD